MEVVKILESKIKLSLPGVTAQYEMAPLGRAKSLDLSKSYTKAAVLCLIYPKRNVWHVVFIQRSSHEKDKHSAQIAFPGGKMEDEDKSYVDTALREANEEIGLELNSVKIIGPMTTLKIPVSGFEVFPILAYASSDLNFVAQPTEVEEIIEIPLRAILDSHNRKKKAVTMASGYRLTDVPLFEFGDVVIWGATAMMLNELVHLLEN